MANQEQLEILKQGADAWNQWREQNPKVEINLSGTVLSEIDLSGVNFMLANLRKVIFLDVDLSSAYLDRSVLVGAKLNQVRLMGSMLNGTDLGGANLQETDFSKAYLIDANLRESNLFAANFTAAILKGAKFENAKIGYTNFSDTNLSDVIGLEEANHVSSSTIGTNTLRFFRGNIPENFLRGCGLLDWEIQSAKLYNPNLTNEEIVKIQYRMFDLRATQALQISPLFISYSHADTDFVNYIDHAFTDKGVRFWRDIHDMKAGRIETQIDLAIRQNPTVLLILSKNSLSSDWVEHEVRRARKLEKELGRDALCPIALDDAWKSSSWPERVIEQIMEYNILDFSGWEDKLTFEGKFAKLLSGLDLFYKKLEK
jgi:uncharacterized protein YjbI with pentapeptide repeats